jgi:micrococcal nuclease
MSPDAAQRVLLRLLLTLPLAAAFTWPTAAAADCTMPPKPANLVPATVERVSDGDTVMLRFPDGRRRRTRLIGIEAPELHIPDLGQQAAAFAKQLLDGQPVDVEQDVEKRDRYGRLLAYLWLADGSMVNVTSVREGYAQPFTKSPNVRYAALFRRCGQEAREEGRGLWRQP